jgi:hypothetical protein
MKGAKPRRVGKKKFNQILNSEIAKVEESRPVRVRRNGVEINSQLQEEYIKDKEELSATSQSTIRPLTKNGTLKLSYFNKPCIYMLYKNDKIVYIGQTECLARRIAEHTQTDKDFDSFVIHSFIEDQYIRLKKEEILIRKYKPKYNSTHK